VTAPEVDVAAALADAGASYVVPVQLAADPCVSGSGAGGGSLVLLGRGGLPPPPGSPSAFSLPGDRLERLLMPSRNAENGE